MKIIEKDFKGVVFQGDIAIMRVAKKDVPSGVEDQKSDIIAHSETGHNHTASYATVLGGLDPMVMFMKAGNKGYIDIVHHRTFDTHETLRLLADEGDTFTIKRQREYSPQGWRRVED